MTTPTSTANRGKATEKKVETILKSMNNRSDTTYLRFPDSRSARNFLAAQPADFLVVSKGQPIFLEVKHTNHKCRLAKDKLPQHATLCKFTSAGAYAYVLVEHEGVGWRMIPIDALPIGPASWDLSGWEVFDSAEAALLSTGYF